MSNMETTPQEIEHYQVGDRVEVYCDHNRDKNRVRDWLKGVVVQADYKMVAVQFVEDVYLTGGWMIPDRVLWCQQNSGMIRWATKRRRRKAKAKK
jgi:TusA-related sulfurtransferase